MRGYKSGRFSFNIKGGRCEACSGDGIKKIEMHFWRIYLFLARYVRVRDITEKLLKLNTRAKIFMKCLK